jgi:hypothetical protein
MVEVRGYKRGAQLKDLLRLGRFRTRFVQEEFRLPNAMWYVVNQFAEDDPAARPPVLSANPNEMATFAEDDGMAIDTADLLRLWLAVQAGIRSTDEVRSALVRLTGVARSDMPEQSQVDDPNP